MRIHLIAIGGSAMHNLALALHENGHQVSGSDDEIFEPSRTRLLQKGLLPEKDGWFPEKIDSALDAVILGMHAREDNPELQAAIKEGVPVYSYPDFIYEHAKNKQRIVISGSHGKTSITAMILHVMHQCGVQPDFLVGAQLKGFDTMVRLSDASQMMVIEGDEYLSSPLQRIPKFHIYQPHIAVISGIAWDHINVFPTFDNYVEQFRIFLDKIEKGGCLIYNLEDEQVKKLAENHITDIQKIGYSTHPHKIVNGLTYLLHKNGETPLKIFGRHNLQNLNAALQVCLSVGINENDFYQAISSFEGAARRLERVALNEKYAIFKDFAHSPSKLKATIDAVKEQFPERKLIACMELHTFSSLNEAFLSEYKDSMINADEAFVYFNPQTLAHKNLKIIDMHTIEHAFGGNNLKVCDQSASVLDALKKADYSNTVLLMMSSGNFDGLDLNKMEDLLGLKKH
jgi:UDP-N-acetylmuramate: L-alanyl-gamma-D-glutamyl-meso-diaminopimelate ligase